MCPAVMSWCLALRLIRLSNDVSENPGPTNGSGNGNGSNGGGGGKANKAVRSILKPYKVRRCSVGK